MQTSWLTEPLPLGRLPLNRIGAVGVYATALFAILGAAVGTVPLGPIHLFPYRVLLPGLLGLFALAALYTPASVFPAHLYRVRLHLLFLGLWLAWALVNVAQVRDLGAWTTHVLFIFTGVSLIFLTAFYLRHPAQLVRLARLWLGLLGILIGFGLWQHLTGFQLGISEFANSSGADRFNPTGTFPRLNQYAVFLALSAPLLLAPLATARHWAGVAAALAALGLVAYLLVLTGSRLSLLALAAEVAVAMVVFFPGHRRRLMGAAAALAGVAGLLVAPQQVLGLVTEVGAQVQAIYGQILEGRGSGGVRFNLTLNGLLFARDSGGLGVGAGNFEAYIESGYGYYDTVYRTWAQEKLIAQPHNLWIELLAEYGVAVFVGFVVFFVDLFRRVVARFRRVEDERERYLGQILILGLTGYLVASPALGYFTNFRPQWLLLALAVAYVALPAPAASRTTSE